MRLGRALNHNLMPTDLHIVFEFVGFSECDRLNVTLVLSAFKWSGRLEKWYMHEIFFHLRKKESCAYILCLNNLFKFVCNIFKAHLIY